MNLLWKISALRYAMSYGMSFIRMCLHYKMVPLWIMDVTEIFSLMQSVLMVAECGFMVR